MIYLIIGNSSVIEKEISEIIDKSKIDSNSIYKYNLEEDSFLKPLENLDTFSMFDTKKIIICKNLSKIDVDDKLGNYIDHPSDNILILTNENKLDGRKQIFKKLLEKAEVIEPTSDMYEYIKKSFGEYKIDTRSIRLLEEYTVGDYARIKHEIEKLKQYKLDDKIINLDDIDDIVTKTSSSTIFNMIDALDDKNHEKVYKLCREFLANGEDEVKILSSLARNYILIYQVKILSDDFSLKEIKEKLVGVAHPYAISKAYEKTFTYTKEKLKYLIQELGTIDIKIKTGQAKKEIELPLFISKV
ncbi:MAG TPA: DNA polymerase III subunit delta [Bacilli bacterium]|nr:DNA polymerase III subunit delta [Bacilli bacterium]